MGNKLYTRPHLLALLAAMFVTLPATAAVIDVRLETASDTVSVGDAVDVGIFASMSTTLVGFGFDLITDDMLTFAGFDAGPDFSGVATPDGDGLAGLSFIGGAVGTDILLGIAHFVAADAGDSLIELTTTDGDLTEGFAQAGRGFFDITTEPLLITITSLADLVDSESDGGGFGGGGGGGNGGGDGDNGIPEPATLALMACGLFSAIRRRR